MGDERHVPAWQLPFRVGASLLMIGSIMAVIAFGFLFSLNWVLLVLGIRDEFWPLWPLGG